MARVLSFLIRYFSNYYTLHRSDLAARAAPLDPRLLIFVRDSTTFAYIFFLFVSDPPQNMTYYIETTTTENENLKIVWKQKV